VTRSVFVFVGERRSARAIAMGVTWEDGRLAAHTLHDALRHLGLDPAVQRYLNLWDDHGRPDAAGRRRLRLHAARGGPIVGLGRRVQRELTRAGIPHLAVVHPAARGAIRTRARYRAHVATVLGLPAPPTGPDLGAAGPPLGRGPDRHPFPAATGGGEPHGPAQEVSPAPWPACSTASSPAASRPCPTSTSGTSPGPR
jgi:hypothetical protein